MSTPFRMLVAYDGSPCANAMIEDLAPIGTPDHTDVLVVSVAERWLPAASAYPVAAPVTGTREHAAALAERAAARITELHPAWRVTNESCTGSPSQVIVRRAQEWEAQLVVAGSHGHSAIERLLIGSVSQKIANESHCSVRVFRGRGPAGPLRLLLAYDGHPGAALAAASVADRCWPKGTSVRVVAATGYDGPPFGEFAMPDDRVKPILAPILRMLSDSGLRVTTTVQEDDPKNLLVEEAVRTEAHCVFVGCNEHSVLERILMGTVSNALIARAPCSVEVVR